MLSNYFVGFARITTEDGQLDAHAGGSGTLVTIDGTHGILTAKHVLTSLDKARRVGLIVPSSRPELHNLSFELALSRRYEMPDAAQPKPVSPDLAFLVPPPNVLSALHAKKSFYNLSNRAKKLDTFPPINLGFWILSGTAAEWTSESTPEHGFSKVKIFRGLHGGGVVTREEMDGKFDYLTFEVLYNDLYEGPTSFGGFSGGGLWQLLGKVDDGNFVVTERLLSGVAFYESRQHTNGERITREVRCHGRKSIYDVLIQHVRDQVKL